MVLRQAEGDRERKRGGDNAAIPLDIGLLEFGLERGGDAMHEPTRAQ